MKIFMTTVAVAAMALVPATAQAQLFGGFDNGTLLGGTIGAGLGGAIGSNLAGAGQRDEGTAIGAALGGLAGAAYANRQSNFLGNPYAGQFNPGFNGRNLLGAGIGAGIGGAIGSNLAASGVRQEGTAIGAALGGLAGYALSNRGASRYGGIGPQAGFGGGFGPGVVPVGGFNGGGFGPAGPVFLGGPGFGPAGPGLVSGPGIIGGPGFGAPGFGAPGFGAPAFGVPGLPSAPILNGPQLVPSGQFVSGPILPVTRFVQPAPRPVVLSQPRTVFTAPPAVTVVAPKPRPTVMRRTVVVEQAPVIRQQRIIVRPATCPAGTTTQSDGSCLEQTVTYEAPPVRPAPAPAPVVIQPAPVMAQPAPVIMQAEPVVAQPYVAPQMADCPVGTTQQSDGTCMETGFSSISMNGSTFSGTSTRYGSASTMSAPMQMADCPAGTILQADGSCLSSSVTSYEPSYSASSSIGSSYSAPATTYAAPATTYADPASTYSVPETLVRSQSEYCYAGGSKRYDGLGKEIKAHKHDHCRTY